MKVEIIDIYFNKLFVGKDSVKGENFKGKFLFLFYFFVGIRRNKDI